MRRSRAESRVRSIRAAAAISFTLICAEPLLALTPDGSFVSEALEPQPLSVALETLARNAGYQLVYSSYISKNLQSPGCESGLTFEQAMQQVLRGTNLLIEEVNDHTLTVVIPKAKPQTATTVTASKSPPLNGAANLMELVRRWWNTMRSMDESPPHDASPEVVIRQQRWSTIEADTLMALTQRDLQSAGVTLREALHALPLNVSDNLARTKNAFTPVELRGVGMTLVLVNGRRMLMDGNGADPFAIPMSAVERIEILPQGTQALGPDAVDVVNIVLRERYSANESRGSVGFANGADEWTVDQVLGGDWGNGRAMVAMTARSQSALTADSRRQSADSDLRSGGGENFGTVFGRPGAALDDELRADSGVNLYNRNAGRDLLPEEDVASAVAVVRQDMGSTQLFLDAVLSQRTSMLRNLAPQQIVTVPQSNAFVSGEPLRLAYGFDDLGLTDSRQRMLNAAVAIGAVIHPAEDWNVTVEGTYSRLHERTREGPFVDQPALTDALADDDAATAFNPFGDTNPQTLLSLRDDERVRRLNHLWSVSVMADHVQPWFGRDAQLGMGLEYRRQTLDASVARDARVLSRAALGRDITSGYAQVTYPLEVAGASGRPRVQLSVATHFQHFSDGGSDLTPRAGLTFSPVSALTFRSTWSRAVRAPPLSALDESGNRAFLEPQSDPASSSFAPVVVFTGGDLELGQQTAETWTLGVELNPSNDLRLFASYFDVNTHGQIEHGGYNSALLSDPRLADRVLYQPDESLRVDLCSHAIFVGAVADCELAPAVAVVDLRARTLWNTHTRGLDFGGSARWSTSLGRLEAKVEGTRRLDFAIARNKGSSSVDWVDTLDHPLALQMRASLGWGMGAFDVSGWMNYAGAYRDEVSSPARPIDDWTTVDLQLRYGIRATAAQISTTVWSLSIQNLRNDRPPWANNPEGLGFDATNADLWGRVTRVTVARQW